MVEAVAISPSRSVCWASANVVPAGATNAALRAFARALTRQRASVASVFGPRPQVEALWAQLEGSWGAPRTVRRSQPLLATSTRPSDLGVGLDPRVRPARADEVDLVLPAAEHMFTHEIGYRPYTGSARFYRSALAGLIARGRTYVLVEDGEVVFKADIGSLALGAAQLQGVWVAPSRRGTGLSVPALATVLDDVLARDASLVSLYVNDFNAPALAAYARLGLTQVGEYQSIIL